MSAILRPMLAESADTEEDLANLLKAKGYLFLSEKIDGIRCIKGNDGKLYARSGKLIANQNIQRIAKDIPKQFDMELTFTIDGDITARPGLNSVESVVNSHKDQWPRRWKPIFFVFDFQCENRLSFESRREILYRYKDRILPEGVKIHRQMEVHELISITSFFDRIISSGGEGIILRAPREFYKQGRSTLNEAGMIRYKAVTKHIARVIGFNRLKTHVGEKESSPFGLAKRDKRQENLKELNLVGSFICEHPTFGQFSVGGLTDADKLKYFRNLPEEIEFNMRDTTHTGKPRNPSFSRVI